MVSVQQFVDFASSKGKIFRSVKQIDIKDLHSRKKIAIFLCVDLKSFYHVFFCVEQKSRFLIAHAKEMVDLEAKVRLLENHNNKYKHICISHALCSKAEKYLQESGWRIYNDSM